MSTNRLQIYNEALRICGERRLASLTESREARLLLDDVWLHDGVRRCLEQAQWKFAMRTERIDYDPDIDPDFGYQYAFAKPTDWLNTSAVCADEYFNIPLDFEDEAGYWYADPEEIYVRYVSAHEDYGFDFALWPGTFTKYVATYFASEVILKLTGNKERIELILKPRGGLLARSLSDAKSSDAMDGPTRFPAQGGWTASRRGRVRGDRGRRGQLIG